MVLSPEIFVTVGFCPRCVHTRRQYRTQVTDAGLKHLKGLISLTCLALDDTQVTNAGMEHRKDLTSLKMLELNRTHVTDAGIQRLKAALPNCQIYRD
jgi:hypothetical protein